MNMITIKSIFDKFYKILGILGVTFLLIGLLWSLMHKVGLCAPVEYDRSQICGTCYLDMSPFSDSDIDSFISFMESDNYGNVGGPDFDYYIEVSSQNSDYYFVRFSFFNTNEGCGVYSSHSNSYDPDICFADYQQGYTISTTGYKRAVSYRVSKSDFSQISHWDTWYGGSYWFDYYLTSETYEPGYAITTYPFYTTTDFLVNDGYLSNYYPLFKSAGSLPAAPGLVDFNELQNIVDSTTDISSDMSDFIEDLPTDNGTTAVGQWLSNIFRVIAGGFQGLFYNIFHFFQPYLQGIIDKLSDFFDTVKGWLEDIHEWFLLTGARIGYMVSSIYLLGLDSQTERWSLGTLLHNLIWGEDPASEWVRLYGDSPLSVFILAFQGVISQIKAIYDTSPPQNLSFHVDFPAIAIPFAGTTYNLKIFGNSIDFDFNWYNSIRSQFLTVFLTFLYFGIALNLVYRLPAYISGASGIGQTIDTVIHPTSESVREHITARDMHNKIRAGRRG